ncbi:MAG: uroporphyrinogen-III C-methyltransferase [Alphaproteobacteria bacterium]|nr:uroporphyrinogen-III C-methyltransferase [Alphaproteobacteria bacterium]
MKGAVYLVGAGPGAADLLTLRAARLLGEADVVLYDALVGGQILSLASQARLIPVGKRAGRSSMDQRLICRLLVRLAMRHRTVVRLKGGDPHLFGRAAEELAACRAAGVPVATVPGVTAAFAAASSLCSSLTKRGLARSVTFVTPTVGRGQSIDQHWAKAAAAAETVVVYMGAQQAALVQAALMAHGAPECWPVALVESASLPEERFAAGVLMSLTTIAADLGQGPVLLIMGEAARSATEALALAREAA